MNIVKPKYGISNLFLEDSSTSTRSERQCGILGEFFKKNQVSPEHCTAALKAEIIQTAQI